MFWTDLMLVSSLSVIISLILLIESQEREKDTKDRVSKILQLEERPAVKVIDWLIDWV